ncbi:hypothetical protein H2O64_08305 [Kordia sp. YSTF-M3]|uniref:Uncharacterized protein n=1 Tax=Kordia aestuariivivens TaxID=2759037 RepID=A0ABR7Q7X7_9FLAO|nr:hypothetical protein [Kordia aestuariivivens]MBC8754674.1 hypothetical protein [Kordia aestuariivivens]
MKTNKMNFSVTFYKYLIIGELIVIAIGLIVYFYWLRKNKKYTPKKRNKVDDDIEEELRKNK